MADRLLRSAAAILGQAPQQKLIPEREKTNQKNFIGGISYEKDF